VFSGPVICYIVCLKSHPLECDLEIISLSDGAYGGVSRHGVEAKEVKPLAHRAGLARAALAGSFRWPRRGPGAGVAAGARRHRVCPSALARKQSVRTEGWARMV